MPHIQMRAAKRRYLSLLAATTVALGASLLPASAVAPPGTATCTGTATVTPGLFFPTHGPSQTFSWELITTCDVVSADGTEVAVGLAASGTGEGWCGRSVAPAPGEPGGTGTLGDVALSDIGWESAGSVLLVTGTHDGGGLGTFAAEVDAFGGEKCASSGATEFEVVIEAEFA
jgi:hypothetical protein